MKPLFPLRDALSDPHLLGGLLDGPSWATWRALLIGAMGEPLDEAERALFAAVTGRPAEPGRRVEELWGIVGRRGGKTRAMSVLAAYVAACCDWSDVLAPGEVGIVTLLAATQRQAEIALSYVGAILADPGRPLISGMREAETQEAISLSNHTAVEVRPASFKTSRGISAIAIIADEIAFWSSGENAANPDTEILAALRPSLATTGGPLVAITSPHARKGEAWATYRDHFGPAGDPAVLVANGASRTFNPTLAQSVVDRALKRDPAAAKAEFLGQFRSDVEGYISLERVDAAVVPGVKVRVPDLYAHTYVAFLDAAGGSGSDSMTIAIAHHERPEWDGRGERPQGRVVLDRVEEERPPFSPEDVAARFVAVLREYRVATVQADRWGAEWVAEPFRRRGVTVSDTAEPKSVIYGRLVPLLNSGRVALLDHERLRAQLVALERTPGTSGRDTINHPPRGHDDVVNAAAGALVAAMPADDGFDIELWATLGAGFQRFTNNLGI